MEVKEIKIPVPWGYVAAKTYGNEKDEPILAIHGLLDNAGTFTRLIPLLPSAFYYICIDLPGHGKSSHFPPHLPIYTMNYVLTYKLILDYLNKKQYTLMGHSYGGQIAMSFTYLYPQYVKRLIILDSVHFYPVYPKNFKNFVTDKFDSYYNLQEKLMNNKAPVYTYEEALNKLLQYRMYGQLSEEAAKALLPRSLIPVGEDQYKFSQDQRLKFIINPLNDFKYVTEVFKKDPINCSILIIIASDSKIQLNFMKPIINELKKKRCIIKYVDGNHDVHNNTPELVEPYISKFLLYQKSKI